MRVYQQAIEMNRQLAAIAPAIERNDRDLMREMISSSCVGACV